MNVEILQENLEKGLTLALRFVAKKASLPILNNVLISAEQSQLILQASNMETSVNIIIPAKINTPGKVAVSGKLIGDYVKLLPEGKLQLIAEENQITIDRQGYKANFALVNPEDFPNTPQMEYYPEINLSSDLLSTIVKLVSFSASKEEARPVLASILLKFANNEIEFVTTDGYRLSRLIVDTVKISSQLPNLLIPAKIFQEVDRLCNDSSVDSLGLFIDKEEKTAKFVIDNVTLLSRLVEGTFPQYQKILPQQSQITFQTNKKDLLDLFKIASVFANQSGALVKLRLDKNILVVTSNATNLGNQTAELEVLTENKQTVEVAFNISYLIDVLNHFVGEKIKIGINDPLQPVVLTEETDNYLHVIMPVRTQNS